MEVERTRGFTAAGLIVVLLTGAGTAFGQQDVASGSATALAPPPGGSEQEAVAEELERRIELLAEEVERLRSGEPEIDLTDDQTRALGLAPSAAATYRGGTGVSIAGYGEMLYKNYASSKTSQFDYLRAILYAGYRFNDRFLFNSEIEVEHANEIFVEFAYVDYLATQNFGLRAGMLLMPMGLVNEFHEPTVFMGAERPVTEQAIIPSTWRENGGGVYYAGDTVAVRAYVVNGLNGAKFSSSGVRGGRQKGAKAKATDMAITGRIDITPTPGVPLQPHTRTMQPVPPREPHSDSAACCAAAAEANDSAQPTAVLSASWSAAYAAQRANVSTTRQPAPHSLSALACAAPAVS